MLRALLSLWILVLAATTPAFAADVSPEIVAKIRDAVPDKPCVAPSRPRRLLLFTLTRGFRHESIPVGARAIAILGERTGAFVATHSEDAAMFEPDALSAFDAVCLLNTTGELFLPPDAKTLPEAELLAAREIDQRRKASLKAFVESGHGLIGIHSATDTWYEWDWYGAAIGGYFDGHPWHENVRVAVEASAHPIHVCCAATEFEIADEIYQFRAPYDRAHQTVLLRIDAEKLDLKREGIRRTDRDFAVSWARSQQNGRVYYCSLGHRDEVYWNPVVLRHYLAGIQFALGDLPDAAPPGHVPRKP